MLHNLCPFEPLSFEFPSFAFFFAESLLFYFRINSVKIINESQHSHIFFLCMYVRLTDYWNIFFGNSEKNFLQAVHWCSTIREFSVKDLSAYGYFSVRANVKLGIFEAHDFWKRVLLMFLHKKILFKKLLFLFNAGEAHL